MPSEFARVSDSLCQLVWRGNKIYLCNFFSLLQMWKSNNVSLCVQCSELTGWHLICTLCTLTNLGDHVYFLACPLHIIIILFTFNDHYTCLSPAVSSPVLSVLNSQSPTPVSYPFFCSHVLADVSSLAQVTNYFNLWSKSYIFQELFSFSLIYCIFHLYP